MSSLYSRYPSLALAARLLDGPPPAKAGSYDLFTLGKQLSRMEQRKRNVVPMSQLEREALHAANLALAYPSAERLADYAEKDRRGVAGD